MRYLKNNLYVCGVKVYCNRADYRPVAAQGFFYTLKHTMIFGAEPRDAVVMTSSSPITETLTAGSGRRFFFCPHVKKS